VIAERVFLISGALAIAGIVSIVYLADRPAPELPALICEPRPPVGLRAKDKWRPVGVLDRESVAWMADRGEVEIRFIEKSAWCYEARDPMKGQWVTYKWWRPKK
jgi:hypothetical protein